MMFAGSDSRRWKKQLVFGCSCCDLSCRHHLEAGPPAERQVKGCQDGARHFKWTRLGPINRIHVGGVGRALWIFIYFSNWSFLNTRWSNVEFHLLILYISTLSSSTGDSLNFFTSHSAVNELFLCFLSRLVCKTLSPSGVRWISFLSSRSTLVSVCFCCSDFMWTVSTDPRVAASDRLVILTEIGWKHVELNIISKCSSFAAVSVISRSTLNWFDL